MLPQHHYQSTSASASSSSSVGAGTGLSEESRDLPPGEIRNADGEIAVFVVQPMPPKAFQRRLELLHTPSDPSTVVCGAVSPSDDLPPPPSPVSSIA